MENINNKHTFGKYDPSGHYSSGGDHYSNGTRPYAKRTGYNASQSFNAPEDGLARENYKFGRKGPEGWRGNTTNFYQRNARSTSFMAEESSEQRPSQRRSPFDSLPITPNKDGQFVYSSKNGKKTAKENRSQSNCTNNQDYSTSDSDYQSRESISKASQNITSNTPDTSKTKPPKASDAASKESMVKLFYNMDFVPNPARPGDKYLLEALMMEAEIVHNEIVRRVNMGENPYDINIDTLRKVVYFTKSGMVQHTIIHYLTDLQITHLLDEVIQSLRKLSDSLEIPMDHVQLKPLYQIRFLNFRRLGQTHWFDYQNKKIRLLGMPVGVNVTGIDVLAKFPSIKIGSVRLIRKAEGVFTISAQCLIPENQREEFNREVIAAFGVKVNTEESEDKVENEELTDSQQASLDYSLIEALQAKYNRGKDSDKFDNNPRFLKDIAS